MSQPRGPKNEYGLNRWLLIVVAFSIALPAFASAQDSCPEVFSKSSSTSPSDPGTYDIYSTPMKGYDSRSRIDDANERIRKSLLPMDQSIASQELRKPFHPPGTNLVPIQLEQGPSLLNRSLYKDESGEIYLLKKEIGDAGLQAGAEVVAAWIYRHFGIFAPETYSVVMDGTRYSATRLMPEGRDSTLQLDMPNARRMRMMRIVAAFLQDSERLKGVPKNRVFSDGSVGVYGFGSAFGAFQAPKEINIYGKTSSMTRSQQWIGDHPMKVLFDSLDVSWLPPNHPWRALAVKDAKIAREYFRALDSEAIIEIVDRAKYASPRDRIQMINSLRIRRNAFMEYLTAYLGDGGAPERESYWAKFIPESELTFNAFENRSPQIAIDIRAFLDSFNVKPGHMVLFRGQEHLTDGVTSPIARGGSGSGPARLSPKQVAQKFDQILQSFKFDINWQRKEASNYALYGRDDTGARTFWERANPLDSLAQDHSKSNGHPFLVSATRSLGVASRWIEDPRFSTLYRYVYILSVPEDQTVPVTRVLLYLHGTNRESEVAVIYDATPYVVAVYDTVELKFVKPSGLDARSIQSVDIVEPKASRVCLNRFKRCLIK